LKKKTYFSIFAFFLLFLNSCGGGIWKGVVLFPPEDSNLPSGEVVQIRDEAKTKNTFLIDWEDQQIEVETWRLEVFRQQDALDAFQEEYQAFQNLYVVSSRQGLPMRQEPNTDSPRVYRIALDQKLKVVRRLPGPVQVDRFSGFWYEVLSHDGIRGYAFDVYLTEFDQSTGELRVNPQGENDPYEFLYQRWRPKFFQEQIQGGFIDLTTFQQRFGFQLLPEENLFVVDLPDHSFTLDYTGIQDLGFNQYLIEGANVRLMVTDKDQITLTYRHNNQERREEFVLLTEDIDQIIEEESLRQKELFQSIIEKGTLLESPSYGRIVFEETGAFQWTGYERLSPQVLNSSWGDRGFITFDKGIHSSLRSEYQGAITFNFQQGAQIHPSVFLYVLQPEGLRIVPVEDQRTIEDNVVGPQSRTLVSIFMRFLGQ